MAQRHLQTIFCDDIRHETSGKLTLVGVYSDSLLVSRLPVTLPRLCLVARLISPLNEAPRTVTLCVFKDHQLIQEIVARENELATIRDSTRLLTLQPERIQIVQFLVEFSPFALESPCLLRVRTETEDGRYDGASLHISATATTGPVTLQ